MKLDVRAFALTCGLIWSAALLTVAAAQLVWPGYGGAFLEIVASIYPGYRAGGGIGSIVTVALYGLVDGTIGGALFALLYNVLARRRAESPP